MAAVPYITSGFYSKEQILTAAYNGNTVMFVIAGIVAFLTPFYMMRLFTVVFLGKPRTDHADHAKEVPGVMSLPLVILAGISIVAGFGVVAKLVLGEHYVHEHVPSFVLVVSVGTLVAGAFLGWVLYRGRERDLAPIGFIRDKFYLDELYIVLVRVFQDGVGLIMRVIDTHVIDGLASRGSAKSVVGLGSLFRRIQVGNLQAYAFLFGVGVILIVYLLVFAS